MKKQTFGSRSNIFLMELIIAILFFVLTSAVCLRMFARSHEMSNASFELNTAITQVTSVTELLKQFQRVENSDKELEDFLRQEYAGTAFDGSFYHIYFDKNWTSCRSDAGTYCIEVEVLPSSSPAVYTITAKNTEKEESEIYQITVMLHKPLTPQK